MWIIIIGIAIPILSYLLSIIQIFRPLTKDVKRKGKEKKVLTLTGWLSIILGGAVVAFGIIDLLNKSGTPEQHAKLNVCATPNSNFKYNPTTVATNNPDSLKLIMWICNYGNTTAMDLKDSGYFFSAYRGICYFADSTIFHSWNSSHQIPANSGQSVFFTLSLRNRKAIIDSNYQYYFYYSLHYTDATNKKDSFETILIIDLYNLDKEMYEPAREDYAELKNCLSKRTFN